MSAIAVARQRTLRVLRDERFLRALGQAVFAIAVVLFVAWCLSNYRDRGLTFTFRFLREEASFDLAEGMAFSPVDPYWKAFIVGLLNTIKVAFFGIIMATILGTVTGVARLSRNWLISNIAGVYIEIIRNTPVLVQLFFLYFAVILKFPSLEDRIVLPGPIFISIRGINLTWPRPTESFAYWLPFLIGAVIVAVGIYAWRVLLERRTRRPVSRLPWTFIALAVPLLGWFLVPGNPLYPDRPAVEGLKVVGGTSLSPEFAAILFGLVIYTAAFIAEVVRAGIMAVPRGQTEAARAQGFTEMQILQLVILPQALRIIIPPLISQYLNLTKNSSLAIAIAFLDLYAVSSTMLNQSGRVVEVFLMIMAAYLSMSLTISVLMNYVNRRLAPVER
ncbi:MAG: polar amino acid ABC transporter permease [Chloroflexi bacterium B3_Chlor]|nr:MAG: polar amino acid ABC transporter permease [Chloroflexi bacterium B3_Chlor]